MIYLITSMVFAQQAVDGYLVEINNVARRVTGTMIQEEVFENTEMRACLEERQHAILNLKEMMQNIETRYRVSKQSEEVELSYQKMMNAVLTQALELEQSASRCIKGNPEIEEKKSSIIIEEKDAEISKMVEKKQGDLFSFDSYEKEQEMFEFSSMTVP